MKKSFFLLSLAFAVSLGNIAGAASFDELYRKAIQHLGSLSSSTLPKTGIMKQKETLLISADGEMKGSISLNTE